MTIERKRHHYERIKRNRRFHWGRDLTREPKYHGSAVTTPCNCSCWMCGNERKFFGKVTMQERRADLLESDVV